MWFFHVNLIGVEPFTAKKIKKTDAHDPEWSR